VLVDRLLPGRAQEVRPTTSREIAATLVLRMPLTEASVKIRAAGPSDDAEQTDGVWAGVVPLVTRTLPPVRATGAQGSPPPSVEAFVRGVDATRPDHS